jgi:hypothetical protein
LVDFGIFVLIVISVHPCAALSAEPGAALLKNDGYHYDEDGCCGDVDNHGGLLEMGFPHDFRTAGEFCKMVARPDGHGDFTGLELVADCYDGVVVPLKEDCPLAVVAADVGGDFGGFLLCHGVKFLLNMM